MKNFFAIVFFFLACGLLPAQDYRCSWKIAKKNTIMNTVPQGSPAKVDSLEHGWLFTVPVKEIPAGTYVEFDFSVSGRDKQPEYYAVEYFDRGHWVTDDIVKCTLTAGTSKETTTVTKTFRLSDAIDDGQLQLRIRAVTEGEGRPSFRRTDYQAAYIATLGTESPSDTTRVLCIGNSFTFVGATAWMLKAIAWSQGHFLDIEAALKGGQTFGQHLELSETSAKIREGRYDCVFLQNQSQANARYASDNRKYSDIMEDARKLSARVRRWSPSAVLVFESTWAYTGRKNGGFASLDEFDKMMRKGTARIAGANKGMVSPIGKAFAICREERPDINLYSKDSVHQSVYGAYLKACVNYLVLFHTPFAGDVPACGLDAEKAAFLRNVAMRTVGKRL